MNRSMLVLRIAAKWHFLNVTDVETAVSTILSALSTRLAEGGRVKIRGFDSFWVGYGPPRIGHTPKTGVKVSVPGKHIPHFRAGVELRKRADKAVKGQKLRAEGKAGKRKESEVEE